MFSVLVAADLFGSKLNYEASFAARPTLGELSKRIEHIFGNEARVRRPPTVPNAPFMIHRLQLFDDALEAWSDLHSGTQLIHMCQVYAFQPETAWHREVQSKLPPAVKAPPIPQSPIGSVASPAVRPPPPAAVAPPPYAALLAAQSPPPMPLPLHVASPLAAPAVAAAPSGVLSVPPENAPREEKIRVVFEEIDAKRTGMAHVTDFAALMRTLEIDLPATVSVHELFGHRTPDQTMLSFHEFTNFAEKYPTLVDALFSRCREFWVGVRQREGVNAAQVLLDSLRSREADARLDIVQATSATNQKEIKAAESRAELARCEARADDVRAQVDALRAECVRASDDVAAKAGEVARSVAMVRGAEMEGVEARSLADTAAALLRSQEMETHRAEEKVQELERMLREALLEADQHRQGEVQKRAELASAEALVQACAAKRVELDRTTAWHDGQLTEMEAIAAAASERQKHTEIEFHSASEAAVVCRAAHERDAAELQAVREREALCRVAEQEAAKAIDTQGHMLRSLEDESAGHALLVRKVAFEEQPLIEQELRLRAQRSELEEREVALRHEHTHFQQRHSVRTSLATYR